MYKCTHEHTCDGVREEHVYAVEGVMHKSWNLFLSNQGFQASVVHGTLAHSGAQTINLLLKHGYIIVNRRRGVACNR